MLNKISVDGFRSLRKFHIELGSGLNVLIGPNGSGKSNFINFIDFVSEFVRRDLNSAMSIARGTRAIFSRESFTGKNAELEFTIDGAASFNLRANSADDLSRGPIEYSYSCNIRYDSDLPAVYVSHDEITVSASGEWGVLIITRKTTRSGKRLLNEITCSPPTHPLINILKSIDYPSKRTMTPQETIKRRIRHDRSVLSVFPPGRGLASVATDLQKFRTININPHSARLPSQVASPVRIGRDGEGLAGVLYRLKRGNYYDLDDVISPSSKTESEQERTFDDIVSWCREVNDQIESIDVNISHDDALLTPNARLKCGDIISEYTFDQLSDGTVKWVALVSMLLSDASLSMLEEPENFLHPLMQEKFILLCRNVFERELDAGRRARSIIISTHSPTLIDYCQPGELRIFEMIDGATRASRVFNAVELERKLKNSSFGLGHYYRMGAVYG